MTDLPFSAARFDACLAFGSLYYATLKEMEQAIHEMWRVLKPGGYSFTSLRTTDDWRYGLGEQLEANTFRLSLPDHPEDGMVVNFVTSAQMTQLFADFSGMMALELSESTTYQRARKNSDWLMTAQK